MDYQLLTNILQSRSSQHIPFNLSLFQPPTSLFEPALKLSNPLEDQLKFQIMQLVQLKQQILQQSICKPAHHLTLPSQIKPEQTPLFAGLKINSYPSLKVSPNSSFQSVSQPWKTFSPASSESPIQRTTKKRREFPKKEMIFSDLDMIKSEHFADNGVSSNLKQKLREMVYFLINNFGRVKQDVIEFEKIRYADDPQLSQVFDILVEKYSSASKSREEMIKYILRKALKSVRSTIQKRNKLDYKESMTILCKRYFEDSLGDTPVKKLKKNDSSPDEKEEEEAEDGGQDILKAMLPFRKNSKNKTMNSNFIAEIFSSENFCRDYGIYLRQMDGILQKDNNKKIEAFLTQLEGKILKKEIESIRNCKRLPWLKQWIESTKNIALELATTKSWMSSKKL